MPNKIVELNEQVIKTEFKKLLRHSVHKVLNHLLKVEADWLTAVRKYERTEGRQDTGAHCTV